MYIPRNRLRPLLKSDLASTSALITPPRLRRYTMDQMATMDAATRDAAGAFFVSELERLDPTMHDPLVNISWNRDIDLREDVTLADELSSFTNNSFAAPGGITPGGKAWIGKDTNAIAAIALDIGKTAQPLYLWAMELSYSLPELASAQKLGRPIDVAKYNGIKLKHQMDIDEMVYIGDASLGQFGMLNNPTVTVINAATGGGGTTWNLKTPNEILADVNALLMTAWTASAWSMAPTELRLPPLSLSYLVQNKVGEATGISILNYINENNISTQQNGRRINIQPLKWLVGRGVGSTNRAIAYTKREDLIRYPMVPMQRTAVEARSIFNLTTYYCRLGVVEVVYPETVAYMDGF